MIYVLDEVRPTSPVCYACGLTEAYVKDRSGRVLTRIPDAPHWWLAGSVGESQGSSLPDDCMNLAPGNEISGTFSMEAAVYLLVDGEDFDHWKQDKAIKLRAWVFYSVDKIDFHQLKVESMWFSGTTLCRE